MPLDERPSIHTGGGTAANDVNTQGGDFVGRDKNAYSINFFGPIAIKEKAAQPDWKNFDWSKAEQAYRESLIRHYGTLRVIGATVDSPLDNVFTDVFILNQLTAHRRANIEDLQNVDPDSFRQASEKLERVNGLTLIQEGMQDKYPTNFYILGKPGAGKTTFLKYITIQAARNQKIARIPIFVSLHEWTRSNNEDLFDFIVNRFAVCHVPDGAPFVKLLLEMGKALLLFDGLDEVRHEGKKRDRLTIQLQDFVRQYDRCQHLITCRIAASEYIFQGFRTVEVADFTPEQITTYAAKWFDSDSATYAFFMQELGKPEQKGIYELCNTPLLLSLVCLAFANDRAFPPTHAELYGDALEVLLRRWDASRQIDRDALHPDERIYRELSTQRKNEMFARIAQRTFQKGDYFFRRRDLEGWITAYLTTLPNIKPVEEIDGQIVLKAIEAQHSILIERAKDIYSFSHLTFQEYFTGYYLEKNLASNAVAHLIAEHVGDPRWREVFLLMASLLSEESANYFFFEMQQGIDQLVVEEQALLQILTWADEKSKTASFSTKPLPTVRLAYVFFALAHTRRLMLEKSFANSLASMIPFFRILALENTLKRALAFDTALDLAFSRARKRALPLDSIRILELVHSLMLSLTQEITPHIGFDYALLYIEMCAQLFAIEQLDRKDPAWQGIMAGFPTLLDSIVDLVREARHTSTLHVLTSQSVPSPTASPSVWQKYCKVLAIFLQQHDLNREWKIIDEQIEKLSCYFAANELFIQCLNVAPVTNRKTYLNSILEPPSFAHVVSVDMGRSLKVRKPWWKVW